MKKITEKQKLVIQTATAIYLHDCASFDFKANPEGFIIREQMVEAIMDANELINLVLEFNNGKA